MYTYKDGTNQVASISDEVGDVSGIDDYVYKNGTGYDYDANGNMIYDGGRKMSVEYNICDLPKVIDCEDPNIGQTIFYHYDACGRKLAKHIENNGVALHTTRYVGNFIYKNGDLSFIRDEEGILIPVDNSSGNDFEYQYHLMDYMGNTRVVFSGKYIEGCAEVLETNNYYPFGLTFDSKSFTINSASKNELLYNGKELQQGVGFSLNLYDFNFRMFDPVTARWQVPDRLAERAYSWTPYRYCYNNPIMYRDPFGLLEESFENGFESRKNARKYRRKNGLTGEIYKEGDRFFIREEIADQEGGTTGGGMVYMIVRYSDGSSVFMAFTPELNVTPKGNFVSYSSFANTVYGGTSQGTWNPGINVGNSGGGRPDDDGFLTFGEADGWHKWGKGQPLYVDLDKLDFGTVSISRFDNPEFFKEGHPGIYVRFDSNDYVNNTQALVYGTIGIVKIGDNTIMGMPDTYNFDLKLQSGTFVRDAATLMGQYYAGFGNSYPIYFRGTTTIP